MQAPPLLPVERLRRILAIARADGWSVVAISGASGILALWQQAFGLALTCLVVVLAGFAELHGRRLLLRGAGSGRAWLVGAQLALLGLILAYARYRWLHFDPDILWAQFPGWAKTLVDQRIFDAGGDPALDRALLLDLTNQLTCLVLAIVTVFYQGGLALYYLWYARLAAPPART